MANLILNDVWDQYNRLIQSPSSTDNARKLNAFNIAQRYLIERMYQLGKKIDEFVSDPVNVPNTIGVNYVECPDNFLSLLRAWYRSGSQTIPFGSKAYLTYDDLMIRLGEQFFDTNNKGNPTLLAVKEPRIYFDQYFNNVFTAGEIITGTISGAIAIITTVDSSTQLTIVMTSGVFSAGEIITGTTSGTTATITTVDSVTQLTIAITGGTKSIKIDHIKYPEPAEYYDTITLSGITGTYEVGETIDGLTSNATATVVTVNTSSLDINNRSGMFQDAETIEGISSGASGTMDGDITLLPFELDWTTKYDYILTEAAALIWLHMKDSNNVAPRSDIVDGLIEMLSVLNRGYEVGEWSTG